MIRVVLPAHLRRLAGVAGEVLLDVRGQPTQRTVLDALEAGYPMLRGTIRDQVSHQRRPFIRFFACEQDLSNDPPDAPLPQPVTSGAEPLMVVGAIAGGHAGQLRGPPHRAGPTASHIVRAKNRPSYIALNVS